MTLLPQSAVFVHARAAPQMSITDALTDTFSPGWNAGVPRYGHVPQRNASPR